MLFQLLLLLLLSLFIESVNGMACMNFSVILGNPSEAHSPPTPHPQRHHPSTKDKKESFKKIQRDNEHAAFQEKKRKEPAAASAASGDSPSYPSLKSKDEMRDEQALASAESGDPIPSTSSKIQDKMRDEHRQQVVIHLKPPDRHHSHQ